MWSITLSRDDLVSSSKRHQDVAQHLNQFRQDEELILKSTELCRFLRLDSVDTLLLQMMITQIFEDISSFRQRSVVDALKIRQEYAGETSIKPSLTPVERNVIGYIAGYVCRKTRDRLQRSNSEKLKSVVSFESEVAKHENSTCCNVFPQFNVSLSFQRWPFSCGLFNI